MWRSSNKPFGNLPRYFRFAGHASHTQTAAGVFTNISLFLQPGRQSIIYVLTASYLVVALGSDGTGWATDDTQTTGTVLKKTAVGRVAGIESEGRG